MEILAPCGGPEHLKAAVYAGADAVYLGGPGFSARGSAVNFSVAEISEAARFCRSFGVRLYVAVNILARDGEWDELRAYLTGLAAAAPDALIVQDMGVARLCRAMMPDMPLHASTQMSVHSPEGARFCAELGFSRVVVARECDRGALARIVKKSSAGIEVFVHGALCVSVSGQCGLSAVIGGRSGNRGLCAQPCRLDFNGGGRRFALSLKDLSLVRDIPELERMGVCALKIEGRMKRPEYVAAAVSACRTSLEGREIKMDELRAVFSRGGFTRGYFLGEHGGMNGVRTRDDKRGTEEILPRLAELTRAPSRLVPVDVEFEMLTGRACALTLSDGAREARVFGEPPASAAAGGTTEAGLVRLLSRMGGTPFTARNVCVRAEPGLYVQAARVNAMRRDACEKLLDSRASRAGYTVLTAGRRETLPSVVAGTAPKLRVYCASLEQARAVAESADEIVMYTDAAEAALETGGDFPANKLIVRPDRFVTDETCFAARLEKLKSKGAERLLCDGPAQAAAGRALGYALSGGLGLNVFNSEAAAFWAEYGLRDLTASMELRLPEALAIRGGIPVGVAAYGRLPVMLLRRCPFDGACEKAGVCPRVITDRTGRRFTVKCYGAWRELLNADTLWMADRLERLRGAVFLWLFMPDESPEAAAAIVKAYRDGNAAVKPSGHTRGLLERGVL